jgi:type II secretory pathway component PulF
MPQFTFKALDSTGAKTNGNLMAGTKASAMDRLSGRGLFVTDIEENRTKAENGGGKRSWTIGSGVSTSELVLFIRRLATLAASAIPLVESLKALSRQVGSTALRGILTDVTERVQRGHSLSAALAQHPKVFPEMMVAMVRVGETGGILAPVLEQLADFTERDREIRSEVMGALAYPCMVLTLACGVITFLMTTAVPKIAVMLEGMQGAALPLPTQILLAASDAIRSYGLIGLFLIIVAFFGLAQWRRTPAGKLALDRAKLNAPLLGGLIRRTAIARFSRSLGALVHGGVPLMEALDVVKRVMNSETMTQAVDRMQQCVQKGGSMAVGLEGEESLFPEMVRYMISAGEESGHLDEMLFKIADVYEMETRNAVKMVVGLLAPLMILLLAGVVGFIAMAILMPIFQINQYIG